jgi:hypothetical protein
MEFSLSRLQWQGAGLMEQEASNLSVRRSVRSTAISLSLL